MTFYEVLFLLEFVGSVAGFIIVPSGQAPYRTDDDITYDGRRAQPNWSNDYGITNVRPSYKVVTHHIPKNAIPAFVFESHYHMERMVMDWGQLHAYNLTVAVRGTNDNIEGLKKAFQIVEASGPRVAVWLLEFKDGFAQTLEDLAHGFHRTRGRTRHIVFHWPPEFCDGKDATFEKIVHAYEHAESVFQFGYQDERLASLNSSKFKPWPLGPAWWKGWVSPSSYSLLPAIKREHLASFRGSNNSHLPFFQELQGMFSNYNQIPDVIIEGYGNWTKGMDGEESRSRYAVLLQTSMYGLCLPGSNPNSYRIVETIESGAVPVIVAKKGLHACYDNWSALYGHPTGTQYPWIPKAPMVVLQSWDQLPHRLEKMLTASNRRSFALRAWYEKWRKSFIAAFASAI